MSDNSPCAGSSLVSSLEDGLQTPGDIGDGSVTSSRDPEADITPATDISPSLISGNITEPTRHIGLQVKSKDMYLIQKVYFSKKYFLSKVQ